jgi:hypothetical protein
MVHSSLDAQDSQRRDLINNETITSNMLDQEMALFNIAQKAKKREYLHKHFK